MSIKIILLTVIGFLFLILGMIGLFIPVWPTTPFILVAAGCFSSAPKLRARIMRISFFREYIENYQERKGISRKTVCSSLLFLWGMLLLSSLLIGTRLMVCILLGIGVAVTVHILWIARARCSDTQKEISVTIDDKLPVNERKELDND